MKITSFQFSGKDPLAVTQAASGAIRDRSNGFDPDLLFVFYSSTQSIMDSRQLIIEEFPHTKIVACTSEKGIISNNINFYNMDQAIGIAAFYDQEGAYGVASGFINAGSFKESVQQIITEALQDCDRQGEIPKLVWFYSHNKDQGKIIDILENHFGSSIPIFGGVPGWCKDMRSCYDHNNIFFDENYLLLVLMYPSCEVKTRFGSLYVPTKYNGIVTRVEDDHVIEIDYKSAYEVYTGWLNKFVPRELFDETHDYLSEMIEYHPLGIQIGVSGNVQNYQIFQIKKTFEEQELITFNQFKFGDRITLLTLDKNNSFEHEFQTQLMFNDSYFDSSRIYGIISVSCGGYRSQFTQKNLKFLEKVTQPLMGFISSGEQGRFTNGSNHESNLMLESVIFYERH